MNVAVALVAGNAVHFVGVVDYTRNDFPYGCQHYDVILDIGGNTRCHVFGAPSRLAGGSSSPVERQAAAGWRHRLPA